MESGAIDGAARAIIAAYETGRPAPRLDPALRPITLDDAYAVQDRVLSAKGPAAGWKVGCNPADGVVTCAPLFASRIFAEGSVPAPQELLGTGIEIEFAFRMGAGLPKRECPYDVDDIRAAVDGFSPLIELVGGRFADRSQLSPMEQLADGYGAAVIVGARVPVWQEIDFRRLRAELWIDGDRLQVAQDCHPAGDPLTLVAWLANHLVNRAGHPGLRRGDLVTTGGLAGVTPVEGGERIAARYLIADDREIARVDAEFATISRLNA